MGDIFTNTADVNVQVVAPGVKIVNVFNIIQIDGVVVTMDVIVVAVQQYVCCKPQTLLGQWCTFLADIPLFGEGNAS